MNPAERLEATRLLTEPRTFSTKIEAQNFIEIRKTVWPGDDLFRAEVPPKFMEAVWANEKAALSLLRGEFPSAQSAILTALKEGPKTVLEIHQFQTMYTLNTIRQTVSNLHTTGLIVRLQRGTYALPEHAENTRVEKKIRTVPELIEYFFDEHNSGSLMEIVAWGKAKNFFKGYDKVHHELGVLTRLHILAHDAEIWRRVDREPPQL